MGNFQGVQYTGKQTEYQYFPEDYFSGSDLTLYFEDVYMEDVQALEFGLVEKVLPVYGYNSYTYDAVARGQRIVQGSFTIAFKESGYIYTILEHVAEGKQRSKPMLAYYLGSGNGEAAKPKWLGNVHETIEDILSRQAGETNYTVTVSTPPDWPNLQLGSTGTSVKELQNLILKNKGTGRYKGIYVTSETSWRGTFKPGTKYSVMPAIKARLNAYLFTGGKKFISSALNTSTTYDSATVTAVKMFQKYFAKVTVDGILGPKTLAVFNKGLTANGTFDAPTRLAVQKFQQANGLVADGIVGPATRNKFAIKTTTTKTAIKRSAETHFALYEASIWGEQSTYDPAFKNAPFFYGSKGQDHLEQAGFDIYVNYGQLPEDYANDGKTELYANYNNTVHAIRGVQLTGVQQVLSPTGEPIAERYTFIAKDLD